MAGKWWFNPHAHQEEGNDAYGVDWVGGDDVDDGWALMDLFCWENLRETIGKVSCIIK